MQAEASLQSTFREVEREITEAWLILETQRKRLDAWKPDSLATFADAARLALIDAQHDPVFITDALRAGSDSQAIAYAEMLVSGAS